MRRTSLAFAVAIMSAATIPAAAEIVAYRAQLAGANQVPAAESNGTATAEITVDTEKKEATWTINYTGLSGEPSAAHFHGPAASGENAAPVIDISGKIESGTTALTDVQLADLQAGRLYINIHTAQFPDGEIRGQVEKK